MNITYIPSDRVFKLDTEHTTYLISVVDDEGFVGHLYYGPRLPDHRVSDLMHLEEPPFTPARSSRDRAMFLESFPFEYPTAGLGDFREPCLGVMDESGREACSLCYVSHRIVSEKPVLPGLPATFGPDSLTLELLLRDEVLDLDVTLRYSIFPDCDAIMRSARIRNAGEAHLTLTRALSACLSLDEGNYDLITMPGAWGSERHIRRQPLFTGQQSTGSTLGRTGHHAQPFVALASPNAGDETGEVCAMHLIYSGNFLARTERTASDTVRSVLGIHPDGFAWPLGPGESFTTPEAVMVYSDHGLGGMSRTLHNLYRRHLIRGKYRDIPRPILINNWEATYFDFDEEKLFSIAKQASELGIEMLVMDDGWFGKRNSDDSSLGDWVVNEEKLKGGLGPLVDRVNGLGMKFGIWLEPEMVSPDSDLYRAHPDWAFHLPGRTPTTARNQYVLDLTRREVLDYVWDSIRRVLLSANIEYVKWDMNRPLTDVASEGGIPQGALYHRYVLAVYELQQRLVTEFPNILLENCSSGGGRFDPGMLYFSPQIWCSDDTDAYERLEIQRGTALLYPLSAIGSHVSDCPNHALQRTTPFSTRGLVAMAGTFGYELDVTKISQADRDQIPGQITLCHRYQDLIRTGDYYRVENLADTGVMDAWMVVSPDRSEAILTCVQGLARPFARGHRLRLFGLDPDRNYQVDGGSVFSGQALLCAGLVIGGLHGDFDARLVEIQEIK